MTDLPPTNFGSWTNRDLQSFAKRYLDPLVAQAELWFSRHCSGSSGRSAREMAEETVQQFLLNQVERCDKIYDTYQSGRGTFRAYVYGALRLWCLREISRTSNAPGLGEAEFPEDSAVARWRERSDPANGLTRYLLATVRDEYERNAPAELVQLLDAWFPRDPDGRAKGRKALAKELGISESSVQRRQQAIKRTLRQLFARLVLGDTERVVREAGDYHLAREEAEKLLAYWTAFLVLEDEAANAGDGPE